MSNITKSLPGLTSESVVDWDGPGYYAQIGGVWEYVCAMYRSAVTLFGRLDKMGHPHAPVVGLPNPVE